MGRRTGLQQRWAETVNLDLVQYIALGSLGPEVQIKGCNSHFAVITHKKT